MTQGKPPDSSNPPRQDGEPNADELQRTRYGNPHAPEYEAVRISKPVQVSAMPLAPSPPPAAGPLPTPARHAAPDGGFSKTMFGMPADLQAVLRSASAAPPQSSAARSSQPSAAGQAQRQSSNSVVAAQPVRSIGVPSENEAQPTRQARTQPPALPLRHAATVVMGAQAAAALPAQPGAPSPSRASGVHPSQSAQPMAAGSGAGLSGQAHNADAPQPPADAGTGASASGRLSLNVSQTERTAVSTPVRRWPALVLLGLALVAFGALIVLRAPHLLPGPVGKLVTRVLHRVPAAESASPTADALPVAAAAAAAPGQASSDSQKPEATPQTPDPRARPAPVAVQGGLAELEKQALDRLVANDYPAAKQFYDRLHMAAPSHPEYALMVELLARTLAEPACGQPGQEPCR